VTLDPELQRILEAMLAAEGPQAEDAPVEQVRAAHIAETEHLAGEGPEIASVRDDTVAGVPVRVYEPDGARGTVAYLHGGGWVLGNLDSVDAVCRALADAAGARVVSIDYRLAPEHPFPAAVDDATAAVGALEGDLVVAGDSAGGNLAAVVAQVMRDHGMTNLRHQALLYPATDLTMSSPSLDEHANAPVLTRRSVDAFRDHYLAPGADPRDPLVSPLWGELQGLPPALVQTADVDPIRDDGVRYAAALEAAGVPARLTNYLGMPHGFASFPGASPLGRQQRAELVTELSRALAGRLP
jgi:acetyl esterase